MNNELSRGSNENHVMVIADTGNNRVLLVDFSKRVLACSPRILEPKGLAADQHAGIVYVTDGS